MNIVHYLEISFLGQQLWSEEDAMVNPQSTTKVGNVRRLWHWLNQPIKS